MRRVVVAAEKAAVDRDPDWERSDHQGVREYLAMLAQHLPLNSVAVEQFVALYEKARFSDEELTKDEYDDAVSALVTIMPAYVRRLLLWLCLAPGLKEAAVGRTVLIVG